MQDNAYEVRGHRRILGRADAPCGCLGREVPVHEGGLCSFDVPVCGYMVGLIDPFYVILHRKSSKQKRKLSDNRRTYDEEYGTEEEF